MNFAGLPAQISPAGMSRFTILPAPIHSIISNIDSVHNQCIHSYKYSFADYYFTSIKAMVICIKEMR